MEEATIETRTTMGRVFHSVTRWVDIGLGLPYL
jgi:hypothetical protein